MPKLYKGMDKNELLEICKKCNFTKLATRRMVMHYIEEKTYSEIACIDCVEYLSIKNEFMRYKRKIKMLP